MAQHNTLVRRYWDSSCFLALLNDEEDASACEHILEEAKRGRTELCVSAQVQIEVVRPKGSPTPLPMALREKVRSFFESDYIKWRMIDHKIADDAQRLCWEHPIHPRDAIHLAAAIDLNCDFLETSDGGLLRLDGTIPATELRICKPSALGQSDLFARQR